MIWVRVHDPFRKIYTAILPFDDNGRGTLRTRRQ